ncbi:MAG: hypothetical protein ACKOQ6_07955 [Bacteroidota bacterium]
MKKSVLLLLIAAFIGCSKDDDTGNGGKGAPQLQVTYEVDCPDCYVYCKGPNGVAQNFYHQNNSWTYSYDAGQGDTLVLIAQNTSGAPAVVSGLIKLNGNILAGDTSYCPISGVVIVTDTLD